MSEQKTPGHVLADEAGWHWDSGPQYQEKCEGIARAVCAAELERMLGELVTMRDRWQLEGLAGNVARDDVSRAVARVSYDYASQLDALIAKLREESGT